MPQVYDPSAMQKVSADLGSVRPLVLCTEGRGQLMSVRDQMLEPGTQSLTFEL